jgi:hypothetical protein
MDGGCHSFRGQARQRSDPSGGNHCSGREPANDRNGNRQHHDYHPKINRKAKKSLE